MLRKSTLATMLAIALFAAPASAEKWEFHLAPYLWAAGLNGNVQAGPLDADIDAGFSDLVSLLDIGGMLHFEASNPRWGLFADAMYIKLSDSENLPVGTVSGETKTGIYEGGFSYRFGPGVEGLVGVRHQDYRFGFTVPGLPRFNRSQSWTDGFVGVRWIPVQSDKWTAWLRGDIGAGDSDLVWLAAVGAAYRINKTWSVGGGYRYLDTDLEKNNFKWDVALSGLFLGVDIAW